MTVPAFRAMKGTDRKITMLTAYDFSMARLVDQAGVEGILVGDSMAMVVQGKETTLPVTLDEIIYHAEIVGRAVKHALIVVDLPFPIGHIGSHQAVDAAAAILKKTRCQAVKLEGGVRQAEIIANLVDAGIPVMAHCGLRPQSVNLLGGYKVQRQEDALLADAKAAEQAGAFAVVLECIPAKLASVLTRSISIPTIGIGAGGDCDGQILVTHDILGITTGYVPRFAKQFAQVGKQIVDAATAYRDAVRGGQFPGPDQIIE